MVTGAQDQCAGRGGSVLLGVFDHVLGRNQFEGHPDLLVDAFPLRQRDGCSPSRSSVWKLLSKLCIETPIVSADAVPAIKTARMAAV